MSIKELKWAARDAGREVVVSHRAAKSLLLRLDKAQETEAELRKKLRVAYEEIETLRKRIDSR